MGLLGNIIQQRDIGLSQINDPNLPLYQALSDWGGPVAAGVPVNQHTAMRLTVINACVKLIAETIAALPLQTFNRGDESRQPIRKPQEAYVWDQPNPEMTPMEFWEQILGSMLLDGNAFIETVRFNASNAIAELWPIDPQAVRIERFSRDPNMPAYDPSRAGRKAYLIGETVYDASQILHIPAFRAAGSDRGLSPIGAAREAIGVSLAAEKLAARFFGNGSVLSGVLEVQGDLAAAGARLGIDPQKVAEDIANRFRLIHGGPDNAFKVGVIDNGAKFSPLGIPPGDLQFLESRKFQVLEICRLYQVPPHMVAEVDGSTSWGTGIETQNIQMVIYSLLRWVRRTEQAVTKFLLPSRDRYARWNLSALLRGDSAARAAYYTAGRTGGWLSINDVRRLEELPPVDGGDDHLQPLNMAPVDGAARPLPPRSEPASQNGARNGPTDAAPVGA